MTDTSSIKPAEPRQTVQVTLSDGQTLEGPKGTKLEAFLWTVCDAVCVPFMAALVDGILRELSYPIERDCFVEPFNLSHSDGVRIYRRSLAFLMVAAIWRLFPHVEIYVDHSLPFGGYFCETRNREPFTKKELVTITEEMHHMVKDDLPLTAEEMPLEDVIEIFRQRSELDKVALLQNRSQNNKKPYLRMYTLKGYRDYFHGYMVPSTRYLRQFRLMAWGDGFILQFPRRHQPTQLQPPHEYPQFVTVFREYGRWLRLLGVENVSELNEALIQGRLRRIILVSEALHERRIADIARQIWERRDEVRLILIAGPSSSGKTTFSKRLAVQLLAHGLRPFALELDNYFVEREKTPRDEHGEYDFEALEAVDIHAFNEHLNALLQGEEVQLPKFNFHTGKRELGARVRLESDHIIIVEGIHGLNPKLVQAISETCVFRIYVSALTQLNLDRHTRVPTTDTRLIRRIVRDARTRGYNATETIARWESVRRGEKQHIFPYQENADVMFNSALVYELAVLKPCVEPLLLQVPLDSLQRVETKRLLAFLQWFADADADIVPENSILREFIGGLALDEFDWE
jgi:uridine kinase